MRTSLKFGDQILWLLPTISLIFPALSHARDEVTKNGLPTDYATVPSVRDLQVRLAHEERLAAQGALDPTAILADNTHNAVMHGLADELLKAGAIGLPPIPTSGTHEIAAGLFADSSAAAPATVSSATPHSYVWGPLMNPTLRIKITDQQFGLTESDKVKINLLLSSLPVADLMGVKEIVFDAVNVIGNTFEDNNGRLTIHRARVGDPRFDWVMTNDLSSVVGIHAYDHVMSRTEKDEWENLSGASDDVSAASLFGAYFATYINNENFLSFAVLSPSELAKRLLVASLFTNPGSQVTDFYKASHGEVTMHYDVAYQKATPGDVLSDEIIVFGPYTFELKNGKIIGYTVRPATAAAGASGMITLLPVIPIDPPVTVPQTVLGRIFKK